ncbi:hypothetical protein C2S53_009214 [Perilla frutescens var. hirtella]|uniref:DUF1985 domain-containing protein n=1 Tax=Perilla frutescens var. hirtella TaxID=608512 RepID=A0AAD4NYK7_PERFH|nr:hypothetical protein C2S53_009214 [Perilla frutescens var. hirtella]
MASQSENNGLNSISSLPRNESMEAENSRADTEIQDKNDDVCVIKKKRKKASDVWFDFDDVEDPKLGRKAVCKHCKDRFAYVVGGKLSALGQLHVIMNDVRERLSDKNVEAFRRTCFGHLLDVPRIQPQMQLIFLMLNSLMEESEINDMIFELGRQEFFCISGLSFKESGRLPSSSNIHGHIFGGDPNLKAVDIYEAFKNYSKTHKGSGSLVLKLALLYVVYGLLLNRDQLWKKIEIDYMYLVDDLNAFNKYPWGRVAYDHLVHWIHWARGNVDRLTVQSDRPSTDVCGFFLCIQIFTFEIMPMLVKHCATRIDSVAFPRLCRWTTNAYFKYTVLLSYFQSSDIRGMMHFEFSNDERGRLRAAGLSDEDAMQWVSEVHARERQNYNNLKLVDEDDDNQEGVMKPNFDEGLEDISKANADDDLEEVRLRKGSQSSESRRLRREHASKIERMLRAATVSSSANRGSEDTKSEQSLAQLAKTVLEMNVRMQNDSKCIEKMSEMMKGMNVMLNSVVNKIFGIEKSVDGLKARLDGFSSVDDQATVSIHREDPPEMAMRTGQTNEEFVGGRSVEKKGGDVGAVECVDKLLTKQSFEAVAYTERQGGKVRVVDCVEKPPKNERFVEVESIVERQGVDAGDVASVDKVPINESFEGVGNAERQGADCLPNQRLLDLLEDVFAEEVVHPHNKLEHGAGSTLVDEMKMTEAQSPRYEISDISAYELSETLGKMEQENPPAKKRLFEEVSGSVEPIYGTIRGDPLPKKRKTRGKNIANTKLVKLSSLRWETFDPHREYDWAVERDFHHWFNEAKGKNS